MHAEKLRLLSDPPLPQEEVQMLVMKMVARSPNVTSTLEGKVKWLWEGLTRIPHMAGAEREGPDNNPITTARTSTGIQQGTIRRTPDTGKSGPYGGRIGYRTVAGPDKYRNPNNHASHGSDQKNTGK